MILVVLPKILQDLLVQTIAGVGSSGAAAGRAGTPCGWSVTTLAFVTTVTSVSERIPDFPRDQARGRDGGGAGGWRAPGCFVIRLAGVVGGGAAGGGGPGGL